MLLLILDSRCAAQSAREALELCLKTVIPSLFPMFVLSGLLVSELSGTSGKVLSALERWLGLPRGIGSILLIGIAGGFPVGAQCITQAVEAGSLSGEDGEKMLGFCNNCSPAFLFGIVGGVFGNMSAPLLIFLIQLETALLLASYTDFKQASSLKVEEHPCTITDAVFRGIRSMVSVCAWVILAGVFTGFLRRWVFPLFPDPIPQIFTGFLEITGGIIGLSSVHSEKLGFILCTMFVCFGGFSVWMQIGSLAFVQGLSTARCFRQKTLQALLGCVIASGILLLGPVMLLIPAMSLLIRKKRLENPTDSVYNGSRKGGLDHVVP